MAILRIGIGKLSEHTDNPRIISSSELRKLMDSLTAFPGMLEKRPLIVNSNMQVIGGNMRLKAAILLVKSGDKRFETLPAIIVDWDESKQCEFMVKDNLQSGEWDWSLLMDTGVFEGITNIVVSDDDYKPPSKSKVRTSMIFKFTLEEFVYVQKKLNDIYGTNEEALYKVIKDARR